MTKNMQRIAITGAIVWSALMFLCTILALNFNYATEFLKVMASIYPGYSITPIGSIVGAVYGFFDVYIGVYIFAWVYRKLGK